jgi:hypothetical protein
VAGQTAHLVGHQLQIEAPMAEYSEITAPRLQARIRDRYHREITSLGDLGFRHLAYALEALGPYSAILNLPILLLSFNREVVVFRRPLRFAAGNALLSHSDPPSIALCMGMGVKIYSALTDGTILISSDFDTQARPRAASLITRLSPFPSIGETWRAHREHALARLTQETSRSGHPTFRDYIEMSRREEDLSQYD